MVSVEGIVTMEGYLRRHGGSVLGLCMVVFVGCSRGSHILV